MRISFIVLTYNRPDALAVVLQSVANQRVLPAEVIVADDGSTSETRHLIEKMQSTFPVPLLHAWHDDKGFRIAKIRNEAVKLSSGDYLLFSDGDLALHPKFFEDFRKNARTNEALIGSRAFIGQKETENIVLSGTTDFSFPLLKPIFEKNRINALRLPLLSMLFRNVNYSQKLRGGLLGVWRKDLLAINGWNEDFEGWGLEDSELLCRLNNYGLKFRKLKLSAITYHLWHNSEQRERLSVNRELLETSIQNKTIRCKNGLQQL